MKRFKLGARGLAAGLAIAGLSAQQATAQFSPVAAYPPAAPVANAAPTYGAPTYQVASRYQPVAPAPTFGYPRVAQAGELPAPAEAIGAAAAKIPTPTAAPATTMPYDGGYPTTPAPASYAAPATTSYAAPPTYSAPSHAHAAPASYATGGCATGGCATGDCAVSTPVSYGAPACDVAAPCAVPAAPCKPRRQWFGGLYGLYLNRIGDSTKTAVAYCTDTTGYTAGTDYYPVPGDVHVFTDDADPDGQWGAEIRFGSTFGCDPCGCGQPFAWEIGYWAIDDEAGQSVLTLDGPVYDAAAYAANSGANPHRIYTLYNFNGLNMDLDGAGTTWADRPVYDDNGMPADGDVDANDVRVLGIRVRQRFSMQNLELNFWRFGTPAIAPGCGLGSCGLGGCGASHGGCGDSCGVAACAPCRPPRRFFINGLLGVRYLRIDDDFGLDQQFTTVDTNPASGTYKQPPAGWPTEYQSFPADDPSVLFSDFEATNELVGFQLGCSMNWLVGCRWNFFADSNFGIYGNNADVNKRVYGGGASVVTFADGSGAAAVRGSETSIATVGELRAGVGYQLGCHCRLTAAYRLIGVGGVALGANELITTNWSNANLASHINTNNSIILHGLQTGVEFKY